MEGFVEYVSNDQVEEWRSKRWWDDESGDDKDDELASLAWGENGRRVNFQETVKVSQEVSCFYNSASSQLEVKHNVWRNMLTDHSLDGSARQ